MFTQKSFVLKPADAEKKWYVVDAADKVVGRIATEVANILRGKNSPQFTPHTDSGDFVVVINTDKVKFTGNKWDDKVYFRHTNHIGGLKQRTAKEQLERDSRQIILKAVKGMLPKTSLGRKQLTKLKVYAGAEHPHASQKPVEHKL
jgi:large subunit ribosomal protein L13